MYIVCTYKICEYRRNLKITFEHGEWTKEHKNSCIINHKESSKKNKIEEGAMIAHVN